MIILDTPEALEAAADLLEKSAAYVRQLEASVIARSQTEASERQSKEAADQAALALRLSSVLGNVFDAEKVARDLAQLAPSVRAVYEDLVEKASAASDQLGGPRTNERYTAPTAEQEFDAYLARMARESHY